MKIPTAAAVLLAAAAAAPAAEVTLPKGTVIELRVASPFDSRTAAKGQTFRATVARAVFVGSRRAIPRDAAVTGEIKHVRSPRDGAKSAAIAVKFEDLKLGAREYDIEGVLTSLQADDYRRILEHQAKMATGRRLDVVLIGSGTEANRRASTLVGTSGEDREDLADEWAASGLGPDFVGVAPGTVLAMRLDHALTVEDSAGTPAADDRVLLVGADDVGRAQKAMAARKLLAGEASGTLDEPTRRALARFQIDAGLPATGDLDQATLRALDAKR
jgi:putative peptidoglycan binding protein